MGGNTTKISLQRFTADWLANVPIVEMCQRHTISKDQVLRLRVVWGLPPRNDRRLRHKPDAVRDPTTTEIQMSCLQIQASWNENTREARRVIKTRRATIRILDVPEDLRDAIEAEDE